MQVPAPVPDPAGRVAVLHVTGVHVLVVQLVVLPALQQFVIFVVEH